MNNRRKLVIALGAGALLVPLGAFAQQPGKVWRVGVLIQTSRPASLDTHFVGAFKQGMRELGYVEGKNLVIEWRFCEDRPELFPVLAAELVQLNVDVIVSGGTQTTRATQKATTSIPIVMVGVTDPIGSGFVKTLARPGGNITGQSNLIGDMGSKYLEMLLAFSPKLSRVAVLMHPDNSGHVTILKGIEVVAQKRILTILPLPARTATEIENAFARMIQNNSQALIVANDSFFASQREQIAALAIKNRLPSITARSRYAEAGILMSYGSDSFGEYRNAASYVNKILKGSKPSDLPVEQPTKFELVINGKTAKTLGLNIPQSLLVMADKVIE
jgi:putative ABC transport system substrate-binding protein